MSLRTPKTSGEFEKHPAGMFAATCYQIIDLGTHHDEKWNVTKHLVRVQFETTELMKDGRPFSVGKRYTLSHHEKSQMRKDLESWYGKKFDTVALDQAGGFDMEKLLGRCAFLNIALSEDGQYANIVSINPLPKGMAEPEPVNDEVLFSISDWNQAVFDKLGKKTQEMIEASRERTDPESLKRPAAQAPDAEPGEDGQPF